MLRKSVESDEIWGLPIKNHFLTFPFLICIRQVSQKANLDNCFPNTNETSTIQDEAIPLKIEPNAP